MADIHSKLAKVAGEIGSINKTERNKEQGFNFRSIEQITGAIRPLFAAEGIAVAPKVISLESSEVTSKSGTRGFRSVVHMAYTFTAGSDGSTVETSMVGEAVDYGDKSTSKAVQMAYKYALTQVLQVGSGDDPDAHSVDVGGYEESKRPRSGGRKLTPSPQSSETPPEAARTNGNGEGGANTTDLKRMLLASLNGDKAKAGMIWRETLEQFGYSADAPLPVDMMSVIADALTARAAS